ncbi:MAG: WbqC family protein [Flavobacteriales bacterium]|nr:WbqC family protein [Flavobacteriales bacterium]MBP6573655.1 WbqC family protein [Flavobacteriales bacterium]
MDPVPVISAFYFGSVEHYRLLARHPKIIIDIGEHYERQSYRTRTGIVGPNGQQDLVVQIARRSGEKMPMSSVGLSYVESWAHQHVHAIRSAYGQTPWFIHYIDEIEEVVLKKYDRLVDLDLATMRLGMKWLGLKTELVVEEEYVVVGHKSLVYGKTAQAIDNRPATVDLRSTFQPKKPLPPEVDAVPPYPQVFADRHGFVGRLSVVDLVCNCGPEARSILSMQKA